MKIYKNLFINHLNIKNHEKIINDLMLYFLRIQCAK